MNRTSDLAYERMGHGLGTKNAYRWGDLRLPRQTRCQLKPELPDPDDKAVSLCVRVILG